MASAQEPGSILSPARWPVSPTWVQHHLNRRGAGGNLRVEMAPRSPRRFPGGLGRLSGRPTVGTRLSGLKKKKGQVEVIGKTAACFALLLRKDRGRVGLDFGSIIRRPFHTGLHSVWGRGDLTPLWSGQAPPESLRALSPFPEEHQPRSVSHSHRLCCPPTPSALPPKLVPRQPSELHAWGMTSPACRVRAVGKGQC